MTDLLQTLPTTEALAICGFTHRAAHEQGIWRHAIICTETAAIIGWMRADEATKFLACEVVP